MILDATPAEGPTASVAETRGAASSGTLAFVLHAHLPWVLTHGRWPHGAEWLYEAAAASYLPLVERLLSLPARTTPEAPRLTISLSPVLLEQLADPEFAAGFEAWLLARVAAAKTDRRAFRRARDGRGADLARHWERVFDAAGAQFRDRWNGSLVSAFRELAAAGRVELITTAATHGYLPLLGHDGSIRAQVRLAQSVFERHFGRRPRGFWLPECAYRPRAHWATPTGHAPGGRAPADADSHARARLRPGIEEFLADLGVRFFFVDSHLVGHGSAGKAVIPADFSAPPRLSDLRSAWNDAYALPEDPDAGAFDVPTPLAAPIRPRAPDDAGRSPTPAAFLRDPDTALQVWSRHVGYPGDPAYLDFHRRHFPGGHRYWRVTDSRSDRAAKEPYDPAAAAERVRTHASDFVRIVGDRLAAHEATTGRPGFLCAPFDAELFGHWWYEGPDWLAAVFTALESDARVHAGTPVDFLEGPEVVAGAPLREGSWGRGGDHGVWLNDETAWVWERIHAAETRLSTRVAALRSDRSSHTRALLRQMARELLLLQASDWPFLISTLGARDYAEERLRGHAAAFDRLDALLARVSAGEPPTIADRKELRRLERLDRPFPDVDPEWWGQRDGCAIAGEPRTTAPGAGE